MKKKFGLSTLALLLSGGVALAGGAFSQYPITGVPDNTTCLSYGNNGVCNQYAPAGPGDLSSAWVVPADTGTPGGGTQTVVVPLSLIGSLNNKVNRLIGGDMGTNLWQRGTTPVSAATPSTTVIGADRWAVYSSGNTVTVSKQTGAADTIPTSGFYASQRVSRPSGTNNTQICVGQVLDKQAAADLVGNNAIFSFYALAGAGLSAVATNNITATIAYYTAADSATAGTNTDAFMKGTVAGYTAVTTNGGVVNSSTLTAVNSATIASGIATVPITTTWTRYSVWGKIPSTNAAGTAVTGAGVTICYTPASGTGGSTEWFEFTGAQLQAASSLVTTNLPFGVTTPTGFERLPATFDAERQFYYSYVLTDGAATIYYAPGLATTTALAKTTINFPKPMRIAPSVTVGTAISFAVTKSDGTAQACGTSITSVASSTTTQQSTLLCTTGATALVAGNSALLMGAATGGLITWSAEP